MLYQGSYLNGFAPRDVEPAYPELWRGCVGAWCPSLGPTGGVLRDWSGRQRHGTLVDTTLNTVWSNDNGYCLLVDGTNDYVALPSISIPASFSISMWVNPAAFDEDYQTFLGRDTGSNNIQLCLRLTTGVLVIVVGDEVITGSALSLAWTHVLVTRDSVSGLSLYVNGVADGTAAAGTFTANDSTALRLGGNSAYSASRFFNGKIDDIRFYDRVISAFDRAFLYLNGRGRGIAYSFNQPRGSFTPGDSSGASGGTFPGLAWRALRRWRFVVMAGVDGNWPRVT